MAKWVVLGSQLGTEHKVDTTEVQMNKWIEDHSKIEMAKAGDYKDLKVKATDLGGFKHTNVSFLLYVYLPKVLTSFFSLDRSKVPATRLRTVSFAILTTVHIV